MNLNNARFIGDVDFRQNQQTCDSVMLQVTTPAGSRITYGYLWRVRRFFGDNHPLGELDMRTHVSNYSHGFLAPGDRLEVRRLPRAGICSRHQLLSATRIRTERTAST